MTDLIKRDDALALVEQWFDTDNHLYSIILNDITNLPAVDPVVIHQVDPAAIREAALREAGYDTTLTDRIEEVVKERDGLLRVVTDNHVALQRAEAAEAKLDKVVEMLQSFVDLAQHGRFVLRELEG